MGERDDDAVAKYRAWAEQARAAGDHQKVKRMETIANGIEKKAKDRDSGNGHSVGPSDYRVQKSSGCLVLAVALASVPLGLVVAGGELWRWLG